MIQYIYGIDSGEHLNSAINKNILDLLVSNLLDTYIKKTEKDKKNQSESIMDSKEEIEKTILNESTGASQVFREPDPVVILDNSETSILLPFNGHESKLE